MIPTLAAARRVWAGLHGDDVMDKKQRPVQLVNYDGPVLAIEWGQSAATAGRHGVKTIEVVRENGEMAPVAWFEVRYDDGRVMRYNGKHVDCVRLCDATDEEATR